MMWVASSQRGRVLFRLIVSVRGWAAVIASRPVVKRQSYNVTSAAGQAVHFKVAEKHSEGQEGPGSQQRF